MLTRDLKITTKNTELNIEIEANCEIEVPSTFEEAIEFYGSEEKFMDSVQQDVARKRGNAVRPVLREATTVLDWDAVASQAANSYQPGRRGSFGRPTISAGELQNVSHDDLLALLASKGVNLTD